MENTTTTTNPGTIFRYVYYTNLTRRAVLAEGVGTQEEIDQVGESLAEAGVPHYYLKVSPDEVLGPAGDHGFWYDRVLAECLTEIAQRRKGEAT